MIELENISFRYKGGSGTGGLENMNLTIESGETILLTGESGCGKTTVTRLINGLIPNYFDGNLSGRVVIDGTLAVNEVPLYTTAERIGSVFQNPRSQFFNVDTDSELAFGCENLGMPEAEIADRMEKTVREFAIERLMGRSIFQLSGGEKQKIACASVRMLHPDIYVFDELSSNLDISSIRELRECIRRLKEDGKTLIIAEHRLSYLRGLADRVVYMKSGRISRIYTADEFEKLDVAKAREMGLRPYGKKELVPARREAETKIGRSMVRLSDYSFSYASGKEVLHISRCEIPMGSITAVIGNNGAGKSTFVRCLCGLEKKCRGTVEINGELRKRQRCLSNCYLVMQDVNHQLFTESVLDEVLISMKHPNEETACAILRSLDLYDFKDTHPMALSGGQKQRTAIAGALASEKQIIVFDEPTSGLDYRHMKEVAENLRKLSALGKTLFIVTHDPELIAECCNYFVFIEKGKVLWSDGWNQISWERLQRFFAFEGD